MRSFNKQPKKSFIDLYTNTTAKIPGPIYDITKADNKIYWPRGYK